MPSYHFGNFEYRFFPFAHFDQGSIDVNNVGAGGSSSHTTAGTTGAYPRGNNFQLRDMLFKYGLYLSYGFYRTLGIPARWQFGGDGHPSGIGYGHKLRSDQGNQKY